MSSSPNHRRLSPDPKRPLRQIRAHQPSPQSLILYQAYNSSIATAAVRAQKLSASPLFSTSRMTWLKPSWCWVCYRSGYGQKDVNQTHILALEVSRVGFEEILSHAVLAEDAGKGDEGDSSVRVQWDPERGPGLERRSWRSIQVGVKGALVGKLLNEWILGIEDVTDRAKGMQKAVLDNEDLELAGLEAMGLHPVETVFELSEAIAQRLKMAG